MPDVMLLGVKSFCSIFSVLVGTFSVSYKVFQGEKEIVLAIGEFKGFEDLIPEELPRVSYK